MRVVRADTPNEVLKDEAVDEISEFVQIEIFPIPLIFEASVEKPRATLIASFHAHLQTVNPFIFASPLTSSFAVGVEVPIPTLVPTPPRITLLD